MEKLDVSLLAASLARSPGLASPQLTTISGPPSSMRLSARTAARSGCQIRGLSFCSVLGKPPRSKQALLGLVGVLCVDSGAFLFVRFSAGIPSSAAASRGPQIGGYPRHWSQQPPLGVRYRCPIQGPFFLFGSHQGPPARRLPAGTPSSAVTPVTGHSNHH